MNNDIPSTCDNLQVHFFRCCFENAIAIENNTAKTEITSMVTAPMCNIWGCVCFVGVKTDAEVCCLH